MSELFTEPHVEHDRPDAIRYGLWARRLVMTLFAVWAILALSDRFGQLQSTSSAAGAAATLTLRAPRTVRGGIFFESVITVQAHQNINDPRIVLGDGWSEGMQANSTSPDPVSESSRDGHLLLSYDQMVPGDVLRIWLQYEVNPTNRGRRDYRVELDDGKSPITAIDRKITVFP